MGASCHIANGWLGANRSASSIQKEVSNQLKGDSRIATPRRATAMVRRGRECPMRGQAPADAPANYRSATAARRSLCGPAHGAARPQLHAADAWPEARAVGWRADLPLAAHGASIAAAEPQAKPCG